MAFQYVKGDYKQDRNQVDSDRTRSDDFNIKEGRFRLGVRGKFFIEREVRCWNSLSREVVGTLTFKVFETRLYRLDNLV